tara:strand:+ start:309 stop:1064 length:756 start_codon:yes stop_codon:yes gene_type:complete
MSWYSNTWGYRLPVSINNTSGATSFDATITVPFDAQIFWSNVENDGHDVRFTSSDGMTVLAYNRATWNYSDRVAIFNVDSVPCASNDATAIMFMYFGNSSASDGSTSPSISSAKTGSIELASHVGGQTVVLRPFRAGETIAQQKISKTSNEEIDVWIDCRRALQKRSVAFNKSRRLEEVDYIQVQVLANGSDQSGQYDESKTTLSDPGWVKCRLKAGSSGTDYTLAVTIGTSQTRVLQARAIVDVQDIDES